MSETTFLSNGRSSWRDWAALDVSVASEDPSVWIVDVRGELDILTGQILEQRLKSHAFASGLSGQPGRIVYRLTEVGFIDLSGLDALLAASDQHRAGTITIQDPSPPVRRLLELVDLDSMIEARIGPVPGAR